MPTVRDNENEGGSSEDSKSQKTENNFTRTEAVQNTTPIWKGKQMEKTNGRDHSAPSYNWRGFLESAQKSMEIAASKDGDPLVNAHRVAKIMGALYDISIHPTDVARVMHCQAIMLASQDQGNVDKHRNVVATAAALAELTKPQLRIQTELANQLAGLPQS
jgi:hypothetical protein